MSVTPEPCGDPQCDCHIPSPPPPVPPGWMRDAPPRTTKELFAEVINRAAPSRRAALVLGLLDSAWDRIEATEYHGETYREAWFAALRAELASPRYVIDE